MIENLTPDEKELVVEFRYILAKFSEALLEKLLANERKYRFGNSWKLPDWQEQLQRDIAGHLQKGDPRDVAIYSLFAWYHDWPVAEPHSPNEGRPLSSLTEEEAKIVFAQAFSYGPFDDFFQWSVHPPKSEVHTPSVRISCATETIEIHSHGFVRVWHGKNEVSGFNAYNVLTYLIGVGIRFEKYTPEPPSKSLAEVIAQGEADFAAGKGVTMTIDELRQMATAVQAQSDVLTIQNILVTLSESIPVVWDRFTHCDGFYVAYGWIARSDNQRDFLMVSLNQDDQPENVFYTTSSAKYSEAIAVVLYGSSEGHNACQKIDELWTSPTSLPNS